MSTYFPVEVSRSGDFLAGLVTLPRPIEPAARPALWTPGGRVGREDDLEMDSGERAWAVVQLARSHRHKQLIAQLAARGKLTLRPGHPGFGATASGIHAPVTSWSIDALHYRQAMELLEADPAVILADPLWNRLDGAGSTAELARIIEDDPIARLPDHVWDELDELVAKEGRSN